MVFLPVYIIGGVVGLILLTGAGSLLIARNRTKPTDQIIQEIQDKSKLKGEVVLLEGTLEKQRDEVLWGTVSKGDLIAEGDVVRTLAKSRAVIALDDGSALRLDENAQVTFSTLSAEAFYKWHSELDKSTANALSTPQPLVSPFPSVSQKPISTAIAQVSGFNLKAEATNGGILLTWSFSDSTL